MGKTVKNDHLTELVIRTRYARQWDNPDRMGPPSLDEANAIHSFAATLRALGMEVEIAESETTGECVLTARHPDRWDAKRIRSRGGGQYEKEAHAGSPLRWKTDKEKLEWLTTHTEEEGRAALGYEEGGETRAISRATYYRRLKKLRERVEGQAAWERLRKAEEAAARGESD